MGRKEKEYESMDIYVKIEIGHHVDRVLNSALIKGGSFISN